MPFNKTNIKSVLERKTYEGPTKLLPLEQINFTKDQLEDKNYKPYNTYNIKKIITSNVTDTSDLSSHINLNEYAVLVYQDIASENGIYKQSSSNGTTRIADPTEDSYFLDRYNDDYKQCVFLKNTKSYRLVNFESVGYKKDFNTSSDTSETLFDIILIPKHKPGIVDLEVFGVYDTNTFYGIYRRQYYNSDGGTTYLDNGVMENTVKVNGSFTEPTITFSNTPSISLQTNSSSGVSWYTRANIKY